MKILGVSLGTKNGNNDTMCRVALEAAKAKGAEHRIYPTFLTWIFSTAQVVLPVPVAVVMGKG